MSSDSKQLASQEIQKEIEKETRKAKRRPKSTPAFLVYNHSKLIVITSINLPIEKKFILCIDYASVPVVLLR